MEEFETPDPEFVKGFNEGYSLAQHLPALNKQLNEVTDESPRGLGFRQGREQFATEEKQERYPAWLKSDRLSKSAHTPDASKNRDIEPER